MGDDIAKRKLLVQKMHQGKHATKIQAQWRGKHIRNKMMNSKTQTPADSTLKSDFVYKQEWPDPVIENFTSIDGSTSWPNLDDSSKESWQWLQRNSKLLIRCVTWNLCGNSPPSKEEIRRLILPLNK